MGAFAIAGYFVLPSTPREYAYVGIGAASVACVLVGSRVNFGRGRHLVWILFATGLAGQVAGDTVFAYYELHLHREPPVPSSADAFYLAGYIFLLAGALLIPRRFSVPVTRAAMLDSIVIFLAVALVQWVFFIDPTYRMDGLMRFDQRLVDFAYPALDALLLIALLQLMVRRTARTSAYWLLITAVGLWVIADEIYSVRITSYHAGSWLDALWLASYVCWAASALDPSVARMDALRSDELPRLTTRRLVLLAGALLVAPTAVIIESARGRPVPLSVGILGGVIGVVVLVRLAEVVRAVDQARREGEVAQRLLRFQNEQLRELDRLKDEFVSSVSHELRTPLTSITGYVEILREDESNTAKQGYLGIIDRNAGRLLGLVSDLLFAARLQDGRLSLELEPVDLRQIVVHAVEEAEPRAVAASVELVVDVGSLPSVQGEPARLSQLFDNLVSNAIKFTPAGGCVKVLAAGTIDTVRIEVSDTGIGVPAGDSERLFERFFRSQSALERQIQGTGLGLYISKAIVEAHGGRIGVSSTEGQGTTFVVELPVA